MMESSGVLSEMTDTATCIDEVKRDQDEISRIDQIQSNILELQMPTNTKLSDYGRLQIDGELFVMKRDDTKRRPRYIFLFDRVLLLCKKKGDKFTFKEAAEVKIMRAEEIVTEQQTRKTASHLMSGRSEKWATTGFQVCSLRHRNVIFKMYAKSDELRKRWLTAFRLAIENNAPPGYNENGHCFEMHSFSEPTECSVCKRLLKGLRFQGYFCKRSQMAVHKECILHANPCAVDPPTLPHLEISDGALSADAKCVNLTSPMLPVQAPPPPLNSVYYEQASEYYEKSSDYYDQSDETRHATSVSPKGNFNATCVVEFHGPAPAGRSPININIHNTIQVMGSSDGDSLHGGNSVGQEDRSPVKFKTRTEMMLSSDGSSVAQESINSTPSGNRVSLSSTSTNHSTSRSGSVNRTSEDSDLFNYNWYVGQMTREEAFGLLKQQENGTFLVRKRQNPERMNEYAISICSSSCVRHLPIKKTEKSGKYYLSGARSFQSIENMIDYYKIHSLRECFSTLTTTLLTPAKLPETP